MLVTVHTHPHPWHILQPVFPTWIFIGTTWPIIRATYHPGLHQTSTLKPWLIQVTMTNLDWQSIRTHHARLANHISQLTWATGQMATAPSGTLGVQLLWSMTEQSPIFRQSDHFHSSIQWWCQRWPWLLWMANCSRLQDPMEMQWPNFYPTPKLHLSWVLWIPVCITIHPDLFELLCYSLGRILLNYGQHTSKTQYY